MKIEIYIFAIVAVLMVSCKNHNNKNKSLDYKDSIRIAQLYSDSANQTYFNDNLKTLYFLNMSINFNDKNKEVFQMRTSVFFKLKEYDRAIEDCNHVIKNYALDQDIYSSYVIKAVSFAYKNCRDSALFYFDQAISIMGNKGDSIDIAIVYFQKYRLKQELKSKDAMADSITAYKYGYGSLPKL